MQCKTNGGRMLMKAKGVPVKIKNTSIYRNARTLYIWINRKYRVLHSKINYVSATKALYKKQFRRELNLENPISLNEKLQGL